VLALVGQGRFVAAERAMRLGEPLPAPAAIRYLPWMLGAITLASLVVSSLVLFLSD
jgi:hypothetical protein